MPKHPGGSRRTKQIQMRRGGGGAGELGLSRWGAASLGFLVGLGGLGVEVRFFGGRGMGGGTDVAGVRLRE